MESTLLLLGFGQVGKAVARAAASSNQKIYATTRNPNRLFELLDAKVDPIILPLPSSEVIEPLSIGSNVVVSFPPDGSSDAILAQGCASARSIVYISTTGVYGSYTGIVDQSTPVDYDSESARVRLEAEQIWRNVGATVLRPPGIYGPENGLHIRLQNRTYKMPGDGSNVLSRIHVDDLAACILAVFAQNIHGETLVVGDQAPTPLCDVVQWLCQRLNLPAPESVPAEEVNRTLRANRKINGEYALQRLGIKLRYPDFKSGFESLLTADS